MRSRTTLCLVTVLGFVSWSGNAQLEAAAKTEVEIVYLANAGFSLSVNREGLPGRPKVLIDALFGDGLAGYSVVDADQRQRLESASLPYGDVSLVLATHDHGDHFDPDAVARFLNASPRAHFVSTPQAVERLRQAAPDLDAEAKRAGRSSRVHAIVPEEGQLHRVALPDELGVEIDALHLHHGRGRSTQNLGFLIHLGGVRVLHIGDTEITAAEIAPLALETRSIDVALVPAWFLTYDSWVEVTRRHLGSRVLVAMHLAEADAPASFFGPDRTLERRLERMRSRFPDALVMTQAGQSVRIKPHLP